MSERIVFVMPDNSVQITQPARRGRRHDEDPMTWLKRVADKSRPAEAAGDAHVVDTSDLPREHRQAWVWDGQKVVVDPSRIKPPKALREAVQVLPGKEIDLTGLIAQIRAEIASEMGQTFQAMKEDIERSRYEHSYAMNAVKKDEEVPTPEQQAVREACRQRLAEIAATRGTDWQSLALAILDDRDVTADRLVRP